jgi:Fe2+ or Zn2+ uptake regulation protein
MNSKMYQIRKDKKLMKDDKYILNCSHRDYKMYYQCENLEHFHCIRCGKILPINSKLNILRSKIFKSHVSCNQLTNHLHDFKI